VCVVPELAALTSRWIRGILERGSGTSLRRPFGTPWGCGTPSTFRSPLCSPLQGGDYQPIRRANLAGSPRLRQSCAKLASVGVVLSLARGRARWNETLEKASATQDPAARLESRGWATGPPALPLHGSVVRELWRFELGRCVWPRPLCTAGL
jgi:hypothetical protein